MLPGNRRRLDFRPARKLPAVCGASLPSQNPTEFCFSQTVTSVTRNQHSFRPSLPGRDLSQKGGRLHPRTFALSSRPRGCKPFFFQVIRSAETGKNGLNSGQPIHRADAASAWGNWALLPSVTCVPITRDFTRMIREECDLGHW